jgi:hypothetical protein
MKGRISFRSSFHWVWLSLESDVVEKVGDPRGFASIAFFAKFGQVTVHLFASLTCKILSARELP